LDSINNWVEVDDGLFGLVTGIEVDPSNADHVYVSTGGYQEGEKVYESMDAGQTWLNISANLPNVPARCLAADQTGGLYAGTDFGVFFKGNGESEWTSYNQNLPLVEVTDLDVLPNSNILRAATFGRGMWDSPLGIISVGIEEEVSQEQVSIIFPNPVEDFLNVKIGAKTFDQYRVIDGLGKVVKSQKVKVDPSANEVKLDMSNLVNGTYQLDLISNNTTNETLRFVVRR